MGVTDRYWRPIEPGEAARVFGRPVEIVKAHLRWLFAVAHCRWEGGEAILKRQPPMGRAAGELRWQHRLTNHLADAGIPAVRVRRMVEMDGLWYEIADVAQGDDVYAGTDTWEPFRSAAHAAEAGAVLARLHDAAVDFVPARPQPQTGFVVQLDLVRMEPADAVAELAAARPAVADYLAGLDWRPQVDRAYGDAFRRLRPVLPGLPRTGLHGDWQTNNLFFEGDRISGIIDFHQADHGPSLLDLATAVERNCFFWNRISEGEDDAYDLDHAAALLGAYDERAPAVGGGAGGVRRCAGLLPVRVRHLVPRLLLGRRGRPREGRLGVAHVRARPRRVVAHGRWTRGPGRDRACRASYSVGRPVHSTAAGAPTAMNVMPPSPAVICRDTDGPTRT